MISILMQQPKGSNTFRAVTSFDDVLIITVVVCDIIFWRMTIFVCGNIRWCKFAWNVTSFFLTIAIAINWRRIDFLGCYIFWLRIAIFDYNMTLYCNAFLCWNIIQWCITFLSCNIIRDLLLFRVEYVENLSCSFSTRNFWNCKNITDFPIFANFGFRFWHY